MSTFLKSFPGDFHVQPRWGAAAEVLQATVSPDLGIAFQASRRKPGVSGVDLGFV